jgi:putative two-component system response regulator
VPKPAIINRPGLKTTVYIVNGNPAFVRLLSMVVDGLDDYSAVLFSSDELLAETTESPPHLVMVMEEIETYRELRSDARLHGIPILFVTVSDHEEATPAVLQRNDMAWVLKNDPDELRNVLERLIVNRKTKTVLCVDDSPTVLSQITKTFAGTPYELITAKNGQEALKQLETWRPDLILTDIEMPVMDGLTLCREIRGRPDTNAIPLIILSSRVDYETIAAGFDSGADEYLTKPFFPDEILNKIESYLIPAPNRRQERILVVNRGSNVTRQLKIALENQGFAVSAVDDPQLALQAVRDDPPDLIVADMDLTTMTAFQLCSVVRAIPGFKRAPFVVMTGKTSGGARKMGDKVGVSAYLTKPFTREGVVTLVERLMAENRSLKALEWDMVLATITSLAKALDERDPYTRFHSENVSRFATAIGRRDGLDTFQLENLRLAGLLHDIGKIGIPDTILHKPGQLSQEEFERVKRHSRLGAEILKPIPSLEDIIPGILFHHERIDGQGYPGGLGGDDIPYMARILAVADTFDALITDRPYRRGRSEAEAMALMKDVSGTQLDPRYVELLCDWLKNSK